MDLKVCPTSTKSPLQPLGRWPPVLTSLGLTDGGLASSPQPSACTTPPSTPGNGGQLLSDHLNLFFSAEVDNYLGFLRRFIISYNLVIFRVFIRQLLFFAVVIPLLLYNPIKIIHLILLCGIRLCHTAYCSSLIAAIKTYRPPARSKCPR